jgi:hypothetical protein
MSGGGLAAGALFARNALTDERTLWAVAALMGALLVGAILIAWADRWRRRQMSGDSLSELDPLSSFREALERGELSKEEFDRIRDRLTKHGRPAPPAEAAPAPPPAVEPPPPKGPEPPPT